MTNVKICAYRECTKILVPRAGETPFNFKTRKFCSRPHMDAENTAIHDEYMAQRKTCKGCGEEMQPLETDFHARGSQEPRWEVREFHNRSCRSKLRIKIFMEEESKTCPVCEEDFKPTYEEAYQPTRWAKRITCSRKCSTSKTGAMHRVRAQAKEGVEAIDEKECAWGSCTEKLVRHEWESYVKFEKRVACTRTHHYMIQNKAKLDEAGPKKCASCQGDMVYEGDYSSVSVREFRRKKTCSEDCANNARGTNLSRGSAGQNRPKRARKSKAPVIDESGKVITVFGLSQDTVWRPQTWGGPIKKTEAHYADERRWVPVQLPEPREPESDAEDMSEAEAA